MPRIYSSTNRIKFTDIPEKYAIPRQFRAKQSEIHSAIVTYVYDHYSDTKKYRQKVVDAVNYLTYCVMQNEVPTFQWDSVDPIDTIPDIDIDLVESSLGDFYLTTESIEWDVAPTDNAIQVEAETNIASPVNSVNNSVNSVSSSVKPDKDESIQTSQTSKVDQITVSVPNRPLHQIKEQQKLNGKSSYTPTPKEDLYIQPPKCSRFDVSKVWMSATVGGDNLVIYTTLPEIPTRQNEISVTTNMDMMTENELMALYPNHIIHTRSQQMYERYDGLDYDDELGCIIPISGFTKDQVVDNIIRYPHLYRLRKIGLDGKLSPFFSTIEIDGELKAVSDVWDTIPDSAHMPRDPEFVKEYVIRRYILERDNGMEHKYKLFGTLDPFLTLFMPYTKYIERGYKDTLSIVKQCVTSRIHYKQSRSPILRRMENNV